MAYYSEGLRTLVLERRILNEQGLYDRIEVRFVDSAQAKKWEELFDAFQNYIDVVDRIEESNTGAGDVAP